MNARHPAPPSRPVPPGPLAPLLSVALIGLAIAACSLTRDPDDTSGAHPAEWNVAGSPDFHGTWLAQNGEPLAQCRVCHGVDYAGGDVGVSCNDAGCHPGGPERCGTCHGYSDDPLPDTGSHQAHADRCPLCHRVPSSFDSPGHADGTVDLIFSGLAVDGSSSAPPVWSPALDRCSDTYCHGDLSPEWNQPPGLECQTCHDMPPTSHVRFARVAPPTSCDEARCHPADAELDGVLELDLDGCDTCHGGASGAPPVGLDGATDPAAPSVGAHQRHTDDALPDRTGRAMTCARCHPVPATVAADGHIDGAPPADVTLPRDGQYDATEQRCVVWCHWNRDPGPSWTDVSGQPRECDACHGFPPIVTRLGTPHPVVIDPDQAVCRSCHLLDPTTHVDGTVDFAY